MSAMRRRACRESGRETNGCAAVAQPFSRNTATTRRPSPASTLNVRAAAALSMVSSPMPRLRNSPSTACAGNVARAPVPSSTTSGANSSTCAIAPASSSATERGGKFSSTRSALSTRLCVNTRSTIVTREASAWRTNNSRSGRCSVSCIGLFWQRQLRLFGILPVKARHTTDTLDQLGAAAFAQARDLRAAFLAIFGTELDLDQLVMIERNAELLHYGVSETLVAGHDHGF